MKFQFFVVALLLMGFVSQAQRKREEPIVYYTDSETRKWSTSLGVNYDGYVATRTIFFRRIDSGVENFEYDDNNVVPRYGQAYGLDFTIRLNSSLNFTIGVNRSHSGYGWRGLNLIAGDETSPDTLMDLRADVTLNQINVPIMFTLYVPMNDIWTLEVTPFLEFAILERLEYNLTNPPSRLTQDEIRNLGFRDQTRDADFLNIGVGIMVGGRYVIDENWSLSFKPMIRYLLTPNIDNNIFPRENSMRYGIATGLRYTF